MALNDTTPNKHYNVVSEYKEIRKTMSYPNTPTTLDNEFDTIAKKQMPIDNPAVNPEK